MKIVRKIFSLILFFSITLSPLFIWAESDKVPPLPKYVIHYVSGGDNLHSLAGFYLKDPRRWKEIYALNENIKNPNSLEVGTKLIIAVSEYWRPPLPLKKFNTQIKPKK